MPAIPAEAGHDLEQDGTSHHCEIDMNHLEPLSWAFDSPMGSVSARKSGVIAWPCESALLSKLLGSTFRLVAKFLDGNRRSLPPGQLATTAHAALELARLTVSLADTRPWCNAGLRSDGRQCLEALEGRVDALSGATIPPSEMAHSFDSLIALLVRIDGANEQDADAATARVMPRPLRGGRAMPVVNTAAGSPARHDA